MKNKITVQQIIQMTGLCILLCGLYLVSFVIPAHYGKNALSKAAIKHTVITQMPFILVVALGAAITIILRKPKKPDESKSRRDLAMARRGVILNSRTNQPKEPHGPPERPDHHPHV